MTDRCLKFHLDTLNLNFSDYWPPPDQLYGPPYIGYRKSGKQIRESIYQFEFWLMYCLLSVHSLSPPKPADPPNFRRRRNLDSQKNQIRE
jgi:hypothetical protein